MHLDDYQRLHRKVEQRQGAASKPHVCHPHQRSQTPFCYPYVLLLHGYPKTGLINPQSKKVFFLLKKKSSNKILCTCEKGNFTKRLSGHSMRCCQVTSQVYSCQATLLAQGFFASLFLFLLWTFCIAISLEYFQIIYLSLSKTVFSQHKWLLWWHRVF